MAKASSKKSKSILTDNSFSFFKNYINNASPVGFETSGQKLWLEYLKPYVDHILQIHMDCSRSYKS